MSEHILGTFAALQQQVSSAAPSMREINLRHLSTFGMISARGSVALISSGAGLCT
jgi:hypothetical protein